MAKLVATERLMTMVNDDGTAEFRVPVTMATASPSADGTSLDVDVQFDRARCEARRRQDDGEWGPWEHLDVPERAHP